MNQFENLTISQMRELTKQYEKQNGKVQDYERFNKEEEKWILIGFWLLSLSLRWSFGLLYAVWRLTNEWRKIFF